MSDMVSKFSITDPTLDQLRDFIDTVSDFFRGDIPIRCCVKLNDANENLSYTLRVSTDDRRLRHSDESPFDTVTISEEEIPLGDNKGPGKCPLDFTESQRRSLTEALKGVLP